MLFSLSPIERPKGRRWLHLTWKRKTCYLPFEHWKLELPTVNEMKWYFGGGAEGAGYVTACHYIALCRPVAYELEWSSSTRLTKKYKERRNTTSTRRTKNGRSHQGEDTGPNPGPKAAAALHHNQCSIERTKSFSETNKNKAQRRARALVWCGAK